VRNYRREWLDELALTGAIAWGRLWGRGNTSVRKTPLCLLPREDLDLWLGLADVPPGLVLLRRGDRPRRSRRDTAVDLRDARAGSRSMPAARASPRTCSARAVSCPGTSRRG
jgi:hypothetical protein